jgi:uroporphyrin-III C-methyltransferase/precorrin-2 dehydrogenase/sirohydrochlorin ferrochelatase
MYPVTLEIQGRRCLVVGGGAVALRKIQGLVEDGALVTVVAPDVVEPVAIMAAKGEITLERRAYRGDAAGRWSLIIAATDDRDVNQLVFREAEEQGVWCNVADDPEFCSFHLPARVRRGPLQVALSSAGEAPFAVARLRRLLERRFGPEWAEWLDAAARFRDSVRELGLTPSVQSALYDGFFESTVDGDGLTARVPNEREVQRWLGTTVDRTKVPPPAATVASGGCLDASPGRGFVSLVGGGPGCPGLLTLRGRRRLAQADAVVFDRLAAGALPADLAAHVELHPVGKVAGNHPIPQSEINALLVRLAREGKRVVRLKGGDPYVFGRGGEEAEVLVEEGIAFEVVPGVTSGVAALAWAGIPATHRRESVRLTLLTAHEAVKGDGPQVRWDLLAQDSHATLVGYMGVTALPSVVERLLDAGMSPDTPAAMVQQGTTAAQRKVVATLGGLVEAIAEAGLEPPALFAIGPTVGHAGTLDWFGSQPLAGRRIVTTSTNSSLAEILEDHGAEVVMLPMPVTPAARVVMSALPLSGCIVRTRAEVDWLDDEMNNPGWTPTSTAWCIGREAADRARTRGWTGVVELDGGLECDALVSRIAGSDGRRV